MAFVLIQSYTSCLVAYLTAPKFIPFVNSVEELANSNEIVTVVRKYTSIESDLTVKKKFDYSISFENS